METLYVGIASISTVLAIVLTVLAVAVPDSFGLQNSAANSASLTYRPNPPASPSQGWTEFVRFTITMKEGADDFQHESYIGGILEILQPVNMQREDIQLNATAGSIIVEAKITTGVVFE